MPPPCLLLSEATATTILRTQLLDSGLVTEPGVETPLAGRALGPAGQRPIRAGAGSRSGWKSGPAPGA